MMRAGVVFLVIVLLELVHIAVAIAQHRIPTGHDGFQYFTIQYYFLNNAIQAHEIAQWIPYMNQGTIATLWYGIQASLVQSVLLFAGPLLSHTDLLSLHYAGIFVDEIILLIGTWMLAQRFFRTPAVFFIAVSVVGSCVWLDQPYWNFRLYYALPLVIELGHRFLETGRWRWGFLSANLLAIQAVGNLPYFLPIASFVVFAYFALFAVAHWQSVWGTLGRLRWELPSIVAIAMAAASFVLVYACLTSGTDQLVSYNPGRLRDGSTTLNGFLTYGGATNARKWLDLVLNLSPWLDFTIYAGMLIAPLVVCGLFSADRRRVHFVLLAITMLLFTLGTFVSVGVFYAWPGMKYFRHIALVTPLVKVLFCFVAGIGFEWLYDSYEPAGRAKRCAAGAAGAMLLVGAACLALNIARSGPPLGDFINQLSTPSVDRPIHTYQHDALAHRLRSAAALALAAAAVMGLVPALVGFSGFAATPRARRAVQCAVLVFAAADVYHFKFAYLFDRSDVIGTDARFVTRPSPMIYARRRVVDLQQAVLAADNPRLLATLAFSPMLRLRIQGQIGRGAEYWSNDAFFFADEAGSSFRVDSWLRPLDQFMRMNWKAPIGDTSELPKGVELDRLRFPLDHPAAARISGIDADKIRFFARAYSVVSPDELVPLMMDHSYAGNLLFVLPADVSRGDAVPTPWFSQLPLETDESRTLVYKVQRFDANNLLISVSNPEPKTIWMSYADVWHPFWQATVNGRRVPVYQAAMAYKAVALDPGENIVAFRLRSRLTSTLSALVSTDAALWLCIVVWITCGLLRAPASGSMRSTLES